MCVRANTSTCGEMQGTFTVWDFLLLLLLACFNLSSLFIFLLRCILKADRGYVSRTYLIFVYVSVDHWVWNVWPLVSCVQTSLIAGSEFGPAACEPVKKSATVCLRVCLQSCGCVWEREREKSVCMKEANDSGQTEKQFKLLSGSRETGHLWTSATILQEATLSSTLISFSMYTHTHACAHALALAQKHTHIQQIKNDTHPL